MNRYLPQKICHGHSDGKTFECGKFLKHSLQQGYTAGLGETWAKHGEGHSEVGTASSEHYMSTRTNRFQTYSRTGMAGHHYQKWSTFRTAKRERCGSVTGEFYRWNNWPSAGSKVAAGERDSRHFHLHPMTFWLPKTPSAVKMQRFRAFVRSWGITMSSLFVALFTLVASSFRTRVTVPICAIFEDKLTPARIALVPIS